MPPILTSEMKQASATQPRQTMRGHTEWVTGIAHLPGGRHIITSSLDGSLRLWDLESGVQIGNDWRDGGKEGVFVALSPNGKSAASGSRDGKVRLWDVETKKVVAIWTGHTNTVWTFCWSVDGERLVSGSEDGTIRVWDVESGGTVLGPINTEHKCVYAVMYSPDTTKIATSGYNENALKIWDAKTGNLLSTIKHSHSIWCLAWTSDQKKLIAGAYASITIFDTATWQQITILEGHEEGVFSLSLFQNDRLLASGSHDKTARLWNLDTNLQVGPPLQHENIVQSAAISADGKQLVTAGADKNAYVWDIHTTLKDAGLEDLLSIHDVPQDHSQVTARKSLMDTNAMRHRAKLEHAYRLPPRFLDDVRDGVQTSGAHSHSSAPRLPSSSASPPHALFNRFPSLFHRSHNTNQSMELQQGHHRPVEVAAVRDKQALYVAPRPECVSDMAKRIKNPTWWTRCILFICCVSIPQDASDPRDTNHPQDINNAQNTSGHQ